MEQQLFHDTLLPKEIIPIGPAAYYSKPVERNISTPYIGRKPIGNENFSNDLLNGSQHNFSSSINPSNSFSSSLGFRPSTSMSTFEPEREIHEYSTVFHGNDRRNPYDPKGRYCETSGPDLSPDSFLNPVTISGKSTVKLGTFSREKSIDRVRESTPSYDVSLSDNIMKNKAKMTSFSKSKRIYIPLRNRPLTSSSSSSTVFNSFGFQKENENYIFGEGSHCSNDSFNIHSSSSLLKDSTSFPNFFHSQYHEEEKEEIPMSITQARCKLVKYPKLKFRSKSNVLCVDFDELKKQEAKKRKEKERKLIEKEREEFREKHNQTMNVFTPSPSTLNSSGSRVLIDIRPSEINRVAQVKPFQNVLILPRPHTVHRRQ